MVARTKVGVKLPASGTPDSVEGMLARVGDGVEVGVVVGVGDGLGDGVGLGVCVGVGVLPDGVDSKPRPSSAA